MHPLVNQVAPVPWALLQQHFTTGLAAVRAVQDRDHAISTLAWMHSALHELDLWLRQCSGGRDLMTCSPDQVLEDIEWCWDDTQ